jgi:2-polyprenyl-3-methyl-5-hydroxy-6-metoxy-1,4-benzoquinol methylase
MSSTALASQMEKPDCIVCGSREITSLFSKSSDRGELFTLCRCTNCGLRFISPRPTEEAMKARYQSTYFTKRTDRGYDNYFSEATMKEITRVLRLNLQDLNFFQFENAVSQPRRYLDIGCAAGYSVLFMKERGWDASGIDIAGKCINFGKHQLGLHLIEGNYLKTEFREQFHCISLWATIEHLHRPDLFLQKIHRDLFPGGLLVLSTCRAGGFMYLYGKNWRYYNFPEHLYYFTYRQLARLLMNTGFTIRARSFYGSGFGRPGSVIRKIADRAAKKLHLGDMMIVAASKE